MSATVRAKLAAAASTVDGVTGQPYFVQTSAPGVALVRLDRIEYPNRFGGVAYWSVVLTLPQDFNAGEHYFEDVVPKLRDALAPHLAVETIRPQLIDFGAGTLPCAVITGHREED